MTNADKLAEKIDRLAEWLHDWIVRISFLIMDYVVMPPVNFAVDANRWFYCQRIIIRRKLLDKTCKHNTKNLFIEEKIKLILASDSDSEGSENGKYDIYKCKCICVCGLRFEREVAFLASK